MLLQPRTTVQIIMALTTVQMFSLSTYSFHFSLIFKNAFSCFVLAFLFPLNYSYLHKSVLNGLLTPPHPFAFHPCSAIITLLYLLCSACLSILLLCICWFIVSVWRENRESEPLSSWITRIIQTESEGENGILRQPKLSVFRSICQTVSSHFFVCQHSPCEQKFPQIKLSC